MTEPKKPWQYQQEYYDDYHEGICVYVDPIKGCHYIDAAEVNEMVARIKALEQTVANQDAEINVLKRALKLQCQAYEDWCDDKDIEHHGWEVTYDCAIQAAEAELLKEAKG